MLAETTLTDETARLRALQRLQILDTPPEAPFENVVDLVRTVLDVPICAVTLIDEDRQWFKAQSGLSCAQTSRDVSFCSHTIQQRTPLIVGDATNDTRFAHNPSVTQDPHVRSYLGVPLMTADGYNVGALCAVDTRPREFSQQQIDIMANFARIVVKEIELRRIAEHDELTGTLSRRAFLEKVEEEIRRCQRYNRPAAIVLADVDHFKSINDTWGHACGDKVLRELARTMEAGCRPSDVVGRLGGEEFALLLPETAVQDALSAAERLREAIASKSIQLDNGRTVTVTASFGIAPLGTDPVSAEEWIALADEQLYAAKRAGRNRCSVA